jgi:flavorubredoxin
MTQSIIQGIKDEGVGCRVIKLRATPMSVAIKEFWKSRGCLIGSPTLNNEVYPSVAEFIMHLRGLRPSDRMMGAFGCYGWGGGAVKWLYNEFKGMKLEEVGPGLEINYRPLQEDDQKCYDFGRGFARKVKEFHKKYE